MEYTNDLIIFEGILDAADDIIAISDITEKAGNERKIEYLFKSIQNFLKEVEYLENGIYKTNVLNKLRQLALFVIMNTDLPVFKEMKEFQGLELLIGTLPTMPRYVMSEILWNLNIDQIIGEILTYSYPLMALDVAEALIKNFKYFHPENCLEKLNVLTRSCYRLVYRLVFFDLDNKIINRAYNNFLVSLKYFLEPPNGGKLNLMSEDELYKFMGKQIYAFFGVLYDCFKTFTTEPEFQTEEFNEIYFSTIQPSIIREKPNLVLIHKYLLQCNTALLETCQALVSEVSVEIFCSWSEFEENGVSLQNIIGELGYKISTDFVQFVNNIEPVWMMLQIISSKPKSKDVSEEINDVDSKTIQEKIIENTDESVQWVKALVHRNNLCTDNDLLQLLCPRVNLLSSDESQQLYQILYNHLNDNSNENSNKEYIKSLAIKNFENCTNDLKSELVEDHFCNNKFNDILLTEQFEIMTTEIFNKLISSSDGDLTQVYSVFIQNPQCVYNKICDLASKNVQQTNIMIDVMVFLMRYSNYHYDGQSESCILLTVKEIADSYLNMDVERDNFIKFISKLKHANIISKQKLLLLIIMPAMYIALKEKDVNKLYFHCKLLLDAYEPSEVVEYRAPLLAILGQVAETMRWQINTFTVTKPTVLESALNLVTSILNTYDSVVPEKDCEWLKSKLKKLKPLNMYYYRCLWNPPGATYIDVICGKCLYNQVNTEEITLWLSQQLCSTTLKEWYQLWDSLEKSTTTTKIVDLCHSAIMLIIKAEISNRTEHTEACLMYCLMNYISILKKKYLDPPLNDEKLTNILNKLIALENLIEASNIKEVEAVLLPLFSFIAERKNDYNIDMALRLHNQFKHNEIREMCGKIFVNNSTT